ncbi:septal ring lytic transglycosylase RlpA family protein [Alsobacter sp. SYSU BS001988]
MFSSKTSPKWTLNTGLYLAVAVLAGVAPAAAVGQEAFSTGGMSPFAMVRTIVPTFTRPDVLAQLAALPSPGEDLSSASGNAAPAPDPIPFEAPRRSLASSLKALLIAPAEAATVQAQPLAGAASDNEPATTATLTGPQEPNPQAGSGTDAAARRSGDGGGAVPRPRPLAQGRATWYQHPGRTASGEVYSPDGLTAAHPSFAFGARIRVVNRDNGRSVVVRINDRTNERARAKRRFVIDLSRGAARVLGISGVATVALYRL